MSGNATGHHSWHNAGDPHVRVGGGGLGFEPGDGHDPASTVACDPASFLPTAYRRTNTGTIRGDREVVDRLCNLVFRI